MTRNVPVPILCYKIGMRRCGLHYLILLLLALSVGGCTARRATESALLKQCYNAIKQNDWKSFEPLIMALKPEQVALFKEEFARAVRGGEGQIDFQHTRWVGVGELLTTMQAFENYTGQIYSLKLTSDAGAFDTKALFPHFMIVRAGDGWRLLALVFPGE